MRIKESEKASYEKGLSNNTDLYGRTCYVYAERFADMLEIEFIKEVDVPMEQIVEEWGNKFSHDADKEGITGFMYGCAISILSQVWEYGEILKKWHNRQYGKEDANGVVNPALLVVGEEKR